MIIGIYLDINTAVNGKLVENTSHCYYGKLIRNHHCRPVANIQKQALRWARLLFTKRNVVEVIFFSIV